MHGQNWIECIKSDKGLKPLATKEYLERLPSIIEANQQLEMDFAGTLPII